MSEQTEVVMRAPFSICYAVPMGKQRNFAFHSAEDMEKHVLRNRPELFVGIPKLYDDEYAEKMAALRNGPFVMPEEKK